MIEYKVCDVCLRCTTFCVCKLELKMDDELNQKLSEMIAHENEVLRNTLPIGICYT
jgi:hypothetical protein